MCFFVGRIWYDVLDVWYWLWWGIKGKYVFFVCFINSLRFLISMLWWLYFEVLVWVVLGRNFECKGKDLVIICLRMCLNCLWNIFVSNVCDKVILCIFELWNVFWVVLGCWNGREEDNELEKGIVRWCNEVCIIGIGLDLFFGGIMFYFINFF